MSTYWTYDPIQEQKLQLQLKDSLYVTTMSLQTLKFKVVPFLAKSIRPNNGKNNGEDYYSNCALSCEIS